MQTPSIFWLSSKILCSRRVYYRQNSMDMGLHLSWTCKLLVMYCHSSHNHGKRSLLGLFSPVKTRLICEAQALDSCKQRMTLLLRCLTSFPIFRKVQKGHICVVCKDLRKGECGCSIVDRPRPEEREAFDHSVLEPA